MRRKIDHAYLLEFGQKAVGRAIHDLPHLVDVEADPEKMAVLVSFVFPVPAAVVYERGRNGRLTVSRPFRERVLRAAKTTLQSADGEKIVFENGIFVSIPFQETEGHAIESVRLSAWIPLDAEGRMEPMEGDDETAATTPREASRLRDLRDYVSGLLSALTTEAYLDLKMSLSRRNDRGITIVDKIKAHMAKDGFTPEDLAYALKNPVAPPVKSFDKDGTFRGYNFIGATRDGRYLHLPMEAVAGRLRLNSAFVVSEEPWIDAEGERRPGNAGLFRHVERSSGRSLGNLSAPRRLERMKKTSRRN